MRALIRYARAASTAALILSACVCAASAQDADGACGQLTIARPDAQAEAIAAMILARIAEDGYGCAVVLEPADAARAIDVAEAAARFVGPIADPQIRAPIVVVGAPGAIAGAVDAMRVGPQLYGGDERRGFFAPVWFLETRPEARALATLAEAAPLFARAGARPRLYLCPAHWECHAETSAVVEALGLDGPFEIVTPASGAELTASLLDAQAERRPWVGYYWTPSSAAAEAPIAPIEIGDLRILTASGERVRPFASDPLAVVYAAAIETTAPRLAAAILRFSPPAEAIHAALRWRQETGRSADDAVTWLLAAQPELWRRWLDADARAAFARQLEARLAEMEAAPAQD